MVFDPDPQPTDLLKSAHPVMLTACLNPFQRGRTYIPAKGKIMLNAPSCLRLHDFYKICPRTLLSKKNKNTLSVCKNIPCWKGPNTLR